MTETRVRKIGAQFFHILSLSDLGVSAWLKPMAVTSRQFRHKKNG